MLTQPIFNQIVTFSIASPCVVTCKDHGLEEDDLVMFTTNGTLPTGISANTWYWVLSTDLTDNTFKFSATDGGTAVNTSASQSGTHLMATDARKGFKISINSADSCR